jgi:hypothetical protein
MQLLETLKAALKRIIQKSPDDPDEPFALVGALKKPRTPLRSRAAAAPLTFDEPGQ